MSQSLTERELLDQKRKFEIKCSTVSTGDIFALKAFMNNYFNYLCPALPAGILLNQNLLSYIPKLKSSQHNEKNQSPAKQIT